MAKEGGPWGTGSRKGGAGVGVCQVCAHVNGRERSSRRGSFARAEFLLSHDARLSCLALPPYWNQ